MSLSKHNNNKRPGAFSLPEVIVALMILALISSTVLVAINRYSEMSIDRQLRLEAFHLARENMEKLLASNSVEETLEYSCSDLNPNIRAKSSVQTFYEPQTERMWIKAVCSASYTDSQDEKQTIEFTHWVTDLSAEQMLQVLEVREWQKQELEQQQEEGLEETDQEDNERNEAYEEEPDEESDEYKETDEYKAPDEYGAPDEYKKPSSAKKKQYDWLPDGWDDMSREEKLNWLIRILMDSR